MTGRAVEVPWETKGSWKRSCGERKEAIWRRLGKA
jgi:hypothetical protein